MFKFLSFGFENYRGIKQLTFDISNDGNKPYCLVGDNEAGKTTILKGIEQICKLCYGQRLVNGELHQIKPIGVVFSESVILKATLKYTEKPDPDIFKMLNIKQSGKRRNLVDIQFQYDYHNSTPKIDGVTITINGSQFDEVPEEIRKGIPSFVYYDDFCFDVPDYVDFSQDGTGANLMWRRIFDNVLSVSTNGVLTSFKEAVVEFDSDDTSATVTNRLDAMIDTLDERISKVWADITGEEDVWFKFYISTKQGDKTRYLLQIKEGSTTFPLNVRSKGFKWFICFVLMSEIRSGGGEEDTIFLLDEPANNMHIARLDTIQNSLLKVAKDAHSCIIFSTHSPGLINHDEMNVQYCLGKGIGILAKETTPVNIELASNKEDSGELNILLSTVSDVQRGYMGTIKSKIKSVVQTRNIRVLADFIRLAERMWSIIDDIGIHPPPP